MRIDRDLVANVARLAALELSPDEETELSGQLTRIVEHFEALRTIPEELLAGAPDAPATPLREDLPAGAPGGSLAGSNAPSFAHGHFVVPRVVTRD